jgi:hypothetical protein
MRELDTQRFVQEGDQHFAHGCSFASPKGSLRAFAGAARKRRFAVRSLYGEIVLCRTNSPSLIQIKAIFCGAG